MGQSWERARASQGQRRQSQASLPSPRLPARKAARSATSRLPSAPRGIPTAGFLRIPQTNHTGPGRLAQLGCGVSRRGSVAGHILGLVTQGPPPIPSLPAADSGHPAPCEDSVLVLPPQRAASRFPGASESPCSPALGPTAVTWQGWWPGWEGGPPPSPPPRCTPAGSGPGVASGSRRPGPSLPASPTHRLLGLLLGGASLLGLLDHGVKCKAETGHARQVADVDVELQPLFPHGLRAHAHLRAGHRLAQRLVAVEEPSLHHQLGEGRASVPGSRGPASLSPPRFSHPLKAQSS